MTNEDLIYRITRAVYDRLGNAVDDTTVEQLVTDIYNQVRTNSTPAAPADQGAVPSGAALHADALYPRRAIGRGSARPMQAPPGRCRIEQASPKDESRRFTPAIGARQFFLAAGGVPMVLFPRAERWPARGTIRSWRPGP